MIPGLGGSFFGNVPREFSYINDYGDLGDRTTYTYNSVDIGTPHGFRHVYIVPAFVDTASTTALSVTIGGISATKLVASADNTTTNVSLWVARVPSGTTASVVVTYSRNVEGSAIKVYRSVGFSGLLHDSYTYHSNDNNNTSVTDSGLLVAAGGAVIGAVSIEEDTSISASNLTTNGSVRQIGTASLEVQYLHTASYSNINGTAATRSVSFSNLKTETDNENIKASLFFASIR